MNLLKIKRIEGCMEGSNVWDMLFDKEIDKDTIDSLGTMGKLIYNSAMEKPFFKVIVRGKYTIKGSEGNKTLRVILPEKTGRDSLDEIGKYLKNI